jgi:uncharacterized protein YhbP (UPF0306 family)
MSRNRIEEELNATKMRFYEATKDMTRSERVAYIKSHVAPALKEYNKSFPIFRTIER